MLRREISRILGFLFITTTSSSAPSAETPFQTALHDFKTTSSWFIKPAYVKDTTVQPTLKGNGFHRMLAWDVGLTCKTTQQEVQVCELALVQHLPAVVYADVYELDNAAAKGLGPRTRLVGKVDLESTEQHSAPSALVVYTNVTLKREVCAWKIRERGGGGAWSIAHHCAHYWVYPHYPCCP